PILPRVLKAFYASKRVQGVRMTVTATKVGVIGCGNISTAYLRIAKIFDVYQIAAVADLDMERARAKAAEFEVPKVYTVQELLHDPEIEIVLNLTVPKAH